VHTPLAQSLGTVHAPPVAQRAHDVVPPQSTPLSPPFLTPSLQAGAWHTLPVHTPLEQSAATPQALPVAHFVLQLPPQSTSVSVPFFTVSVQLGAWQ
jgi:hypothetical protein